MRAWSGLLARIDTLQVVTEPVFWQRYFNSKLWERHRASARSSGKGTAKPDEMFDKYLGELDDGQLPTPLPSPPSFTYYFFFAKVSKLTEKGVVVPCLDRSRPEERIVRGRQPISRSGRVRVRPRRRTSLPIFPTFHVFFCVVSARLTSSFFYRTPPSVRLEMRETSPCKLERRGRVCR